MTKHQSVDTEKRPPFSQFTWTQYTMCGNGNFENTLTLGNS